MKILVLNCGSSSIKYQVIDMQKNGHELLAKGLVERIGIPGGILTHKPTGKDKYETTTEIPDHTSGVNLIFKALTDPKHGVIADMKEIKAVGHRVAHGGEYFSDSAVVNASVKEKIRECIALAPLHNPANLQGILSIESVLPGIPQVATSDTSFHQTIPAKNYMYAIPYKYYEQDHVRKYGFHGTSHKFVSKKGCEMVGLDYNKAKVVTLHIGNGASAAAIVGGKSYDTSMGFTPTDGLIMGTRCGDIDPGVLLFIGEKENLDYKGLNDLINKKSGVQGFTGISSDMRDIEAAVDKGDEKAKLILEMYFERLKKYLGSYATIMGGVDLVVFTGGVGENCVDCRSEVCKGLEFMGLKFDEAANKGVRGQDKVLSTADSKVKVVVATTDEELVIASDTFRLVG